MVNDCVLVRTGIRRQSASVWVGRLSGADGCTHPSPGVGIVWDTVAAVLLSQQVMRLASGVGIVWGTVAAVLFAVIFLGTLDAVRHHGTHSHH